jgi:hypothetical protein
MLGSQILQPEGGIPLIRSPFYRFPASFYANCLAAGCGSGVVAVLPLPCPSNEISIGEPQRAGAEGAPFTAARAP